MKVTCPFTGAIVTRRLFDKVAAAQPHAIFTLPPKELAVAISRKEHASEEEQYLLFMACLVGTNLVQFSSTLPMAKLSPVFITAALPQILAVYQWCAGRPAIAARLPHLTISPETDQESLFEFIKILADAKRYGVSLAPVESWDELAVDIEERKSFRRAVAATSHNKKERFALTLAWAVNMLSLTREVEHSTVSILQNCLNGSSNKQGIKYSSLYPVSSIKTVKAVVLECLQEEKHDDYIRKLELVQALDAILLDRLQIMAALGSSVEKTTALQESKDIAATYTIETTKGSFLNSSVGNSTAIRNIEALGNNGADMGAEAAQMVEKYRGQPEPQLAQFKNRMAYLAAMNQWKGAQA